MTARVGCSGGMRDVKREEGFLRMDFWGPCARLEEGSCLI